MTMIIPKTPIHWGLFTSLEDDLINLSRYIEINEDNFDTYSIELARLFLSISSEIDSVAKELCKKINPSNIPNNIVGYSEIILPHYSFLTNVSVCFNRYDLEMKPWIHWNNNTSPEWWKDHNKVKHSRSTEYRKANLKNVLSSLAGLFSLCVCLYDNLASTGNLSPPANILLFGEPFSYAMCVTDTGGFTTSIKFPENG